MAQAYIQAVTDYANTLKDDANTLKDDANTIKDDANTEAFPIVKKLMSAIKKAGITYFGETEKYINGPYKGQTKSGFVDTLTGNELDGTLYESDLSFNEEQNFIVLNKKDFIKTLEELEVVFDEESNDAWFSDAWGFSLLIDITNPDEPTFFDNEMLRDNTIIKWADEEGKLSINDIVKLSAENDYKIIGLTFEMEGVNMIWFPIPTAAAGGRRRRKTRARRRRATKKHSRK
jgi:hypothetical protein